ncbi:MAG: hypothetical protein A2X25_04495 [Chloroflexi bacterium GWB2_49_20]|nr:MAG: hypothetical protein A2X25_04495 [Chloroflexi bacterium GWB2_49_20]OGN78635.1 MAG: hypothetical protein A2X26_12555 [Chloroflexi bacterium GWC2_49_37]OGN85737.1 MAG: hypothetical protein A2X27_01025 [Chloroflexi bacterium GWD2_49_16]HBG75033.1 hypothetical protein [Anaerolineae bacterium]HCC78059.1 hypothetical protein [Anaerolineae bacterium]
MSRARRRRTNEEGVPTKGNWYLLSGVVIGVLLGLIISWVVAPVKYVNTVPASMRADFKDEFRSQIASAYYSSNNLARAQARLALLGDPDPIQSLTTQAQNLLTAGDPTGTAYLLAYLVDALKQSTGIILETATRNTPTGNTSTSTPDGISLSSTGTPSKLPTSVNTPTPRPTHTPSPTLGEPFILKSNQAICDSPQKSLLLQVIVTNSAGQPIPGTEIIITWSTGEEHFFTGLKPELGDGYADFLMIPDVFYNIQLAKGGALVSNLTAPPCSVEAGNTTWGSLILIFQQP